MIYILIVVQMLYGTGDRAVIYVNTVIQYRCCMVRWTGL